MDDKAAKDLLKETFGQTYEFERFRTFVRELSKGYEERGTNLIIPDSFKDGIQSAFRVGKFFDEQKNEIDILIVKLQKEGSLERARTLQRNFVAKHLSSPLRQKEAALVAFVSPDSSSWRFSLVRRELGLTRNKKGKTKTEEKFSPVRRFSFWVGQGERTHTTQKQFLELLKNDAKPNLKALEKAFDIETVTNAFFEEYRDLFNNLNDKIREYLSQNSKIEEHFKEKDIETSDFAKRLLGQIVFLYFLQKKGWLGVAKGKKWGEGDKEFLQTIYKNCEKQGKNFFHDYLQPLFYSALNKDNSEVDHYNATFECRIPYLNGGLFEPYHDYDWVNQEIKLPNTLFEEFGSTLLWEDGKGILNVFDRYNFTVAEDEPLEREVAIDPEMLGKVFEKLLPVKERGNSGTFYTPREIVHYMCQESLIAFLSSRFPNIEKDELADFVHHGDLYAEFDTEILRRQAEGINPTKNYSECETPKSIRDAAKQIDTALETVKVCDPAVGSGAFPVGMMMEIIRIRKVLGLFTNEPEKTNYDLKRKTIQESLYGVDLDAGAVEIAKLRLWLSLVVDEDNFDEIKALPNLDYKIMQGNSLLQTYEGIKLFDDSMLADVDYVKKRREQLQAELKLAGEQVIAEISKDEKQTTKAKRKQLEEAYKAKRKELDDFAKEEQSMQSMTLFEDHSKAHKLSEMLKAKHKEFFNETYPINKKKLKAEIDALEWELIEASLKEAKKQDKIDDIKTLQRHNTRPFFLWKLQFNDVFSGENAGFDIVVANPPYIDSEEMVRNGQDHVREVITSSFEWAKGNWDIYIPFFELAFKMLNQNGSLSFITPDKWISKSFGDALRIALFPFIKSIWNAGRNVFETAKVDAIVTCMSTSKSEFIDVQKYDGKIFSTQSNLSKELFPIPHHLDIIFSSDFDLVTKISSNFKARMGDFVKCESACATSDAYKLKEIIEDLANFPDDVQNDIYLIVNTGTIDKFTSRWGIKPMTYLKDKYEKPFVKKSAFNETFGKSYVDRAKSPKLIIKGLTLLDAFIDFEGKFVPGKSTLVVPCDEADKLKRISAVLNSKVAIFIVKAKHGSSSYNGGVTFSKEMINDIPVPESIFASPNNLSKFVEEIILAKQSDRIEEAAEILNKINSEIYIHYKLTDDEIAIIEDAIK